jgi:hypothetical protein
MDDFRMFIIDADNKVIFEPPKTPQKATGIAKLLQIVMFALFTVPGRNVFNFDRGGAIETLIGSNLDPDDPSEMLSEVTQRLEKIKTEIIESQANLIYESPDAKLRDLQVIKVESGVNIDEVVVKFRIITESGASYQVVI